MNLATQKSLFETHHQKLITWEQFEQMFAQGEATQRSEGDDLGHTPIVKLFTPDAACTWLLSELDPEDPLIAFGLCDLGLGYPELGSVSFAELVSVRGKFGLSVERDIHFTPDKTLREYSEEARKRSHILA